MSVEVRGVEPRSAEFSVSNSPSAAAGWVSARGSRQPFRIEPIRVGLGPAIPEVRRGHPALATPWNSGAGTHRTGRATYRSGSQRHLWFGTCCCLPGCFTRDQATSARFRHGDHFDVESKSPPCPGWVKTTIQPPWDNGDWVLALFGSEPAPAASYPADPPLDLPALLSLPDHLPFVHLGAALGQRQLHLGLALFEIQPKRHQGQPPLGDP